MFELIIQHNMSLVVFFFFFLLLFRLSHAYASLTLSLSLFLSLSHTHPLPISRRRYQLSLSLVPIVRFRPAICIVNRTTAATDLLFLFRYYSQFFFPQFVFFRATAHSTQFNFFYLRRRVLSYTLYTVSVILYPTRII